MTAKEKASPRSGALGEHERKLEFIAARFAALRRRIDGIIETSRQEGYSGTLHERARDALAEVRRLTLDLKPLSAVASEFRMKWERQKEQLLLQKESEIDAHLRSEDDEARRKSEEALQAELLAITTQQEKLSNAAANAMNKAHKQELVEAVGRWRGEVPGFDSVRTSDVNKAVQSTLSRTAAWTTEQEQRFTKIWQEDLRKLVLRVQGIDEDALVALEDCQAARRAVLDAALTRHRRSLAETQARLKDKLGRAANEICEETDRQRAAQAPQRTATHAKAVAGKSAKNRVATAKSQASEALAAHLEAALLRLDRIASQEKLRLANLFEASEEVGPKLVQRMESELNKLSKSALSASTSPKRIEKSNSSCSVATSSRTPPPKSPRDPSIGQDQISCRSQDSVNEELGRPDAALASEKVKDVSDLKAKLNAKLASMSKGNWGGTDRKKELTEVADKGTLPLREAERILEAQAHILRSTEDISDDAGALSALASRMSSYSQDYAELVRKEFEEVRSTKVALSSARTSHFQKLYQMQDRLAVDAEAEILPAVSKLAHEVEAVTEIGNSLQRGAEKLPVGVVACSWRRAILAAFPALLELWKAAGTTGAEQNNFMLRMLAVLDRLPVTSEILDFEVASKLVR
eukprot:TRINITY_DN30432_c0_g1_i1.p1 TRINITY_DN30432_c0_g1~~TRINITY_DN30432_c0_g1_i1.p1  ORF type:complete len:662 (-),score=155.83 TRINITY_DN30432_c0_g1_i1:40-1950(-)